MQRRLKQYQVIILAIFLVTGVSIAGWAFGFHYNNKVKNAGSQKELENGIQAAKLMPSALENSKITLLLVCTGLIGFFSVRRKSNAMKTSVTDKRPKIKLRINLLTEDNLENQKCHLWNTGYVASYFKILIQPHMFMQSKKILSSHLEQ